MLTLSEVLGDAAALEEFAGLQTVGANTRGATGQTPLHWMATLGDAVGTQLLLNAGAQIDAQDREGSTPLHAAVRTRQHQVVRLLVLRGAQLDLKDASGQTARDLAIADRYEPMREAFGDAV